MIWLTGDSSLTHVKNWSVSLSYLSRTLSQVMSPSKVTLCGWDYWYLHQLNPCSQQTPPRTSLLSDVVPAVSDGGILFNCSNCLVRTNNQTFNRKSGPQQPHSSAQPHFLANCQLIIIENCILCLCSKDPPPVINYPCSSGHYYSDCRVDIFTLSFLLVTQSQQ